MSVRLAMYDRIAELNKMNSNGFVFVLDNGMYIKYLNDSEKIYEVCSLVDATVSYVDWTDTHSLSDGKNVRTESRRTMIQKEIAEALFVLRTLEEMES